MMNDVTYAVLLCDMKVTVFDWLIVA